MLPYDKKSIFRGMTGKEGIGQITNMFYRSVVICHKHFQWSAELRDSFFAAANRPDLTEQMVVLSSEEQTQLLFRYLSAEALMDCFSPLYEACFDARKDTGLMGYIEHVLNSLMRPNEHSLDWDYLSTMPWDGKDRIQLDAMKFVWTHVNGQFSNELKTLPVQALFFDGKSNSYARKTRISQVLELLGNNPAERIWKGLNNQEMLEVELEE